MYKKLLCHARVCIHNSCTCAVHYLIECGQLAPTFRSNPSGEHAVVGFVAMSVFPQTLRSVRRDCELQDAARNAVLTSKLILSSSSKRGASSPGYNSKPTHPWRRSKRLPKLKELLAAGTPNVHYFSLRLKITVN